MTVVSDPNTPVAKPRSRRSWLLKVGAVLAIFGPGLISANAGNDAGGILTYASAGSQFGYRMLFLMVLVTVGLVVVQPWATGYPSGSVRVRHHLLPLVVARAAAR